MAQKVLVEMLDDTSPGGGPQARTTQEGCRREELTP